MRRPIIGITTYGRDEDGRFRLPDVYVDAVRRAGGIVVMIPPGDDPWDELFELIDGLIFAGGGDVEPTLYGGHLHEAIYGVDSERDRSELAPARRVATSELPTLGICRGHQLVNVARGGTLHEHLPDVVGDAVVHRLPPRARRACDHHRRQIAAGRHSGRVAIRSLLLASPGHSRAGARTRRRRPGPGRHDRGLRTEESSLALHRAVAPGAHSPHSRDPAATVRRPRGRVPQTDRRSESHDGRVTHEA